MSEYKFVTNIFEYLSIFYTLTHWRTNVRIYSYKQIWYERMSEYIRKRKIDTNECSNIYSWPIYSNIWIFKYIRHTLLCTTNIHLNGNVALSSSPLDVVCCIFGDLWFAKVELDLSPRCCCLQQLASSQFQLNISNFNSIFQA